MADKSGSLSIHLKTPNKWGFDDNSEIIFHFPQRRVVALIKLPHGGSIMEQQQKWFI